MIVWEPPGYGKSRPPDRDFPANMYDRDAHSAHEFMKVIHILWSLFFFIINTVPTTNIF